VPGSAHGAARLRKPAGHSNWDDGRFIFHTESDIISDLIKIYRHGFTGQVDSTASLLAALDSCTKQCAIP
jgi:hypothetical protein